MRILVAMTPELRPALVCRIEACGIETVEADTCAEAVRLIEHGPHVDVIFTGLSFPDGNCCVLQRAAARLFRIPIPVILCLQRADGGWIDLLESGLFILAEPYTITGIQRVLAQAAATRAGACDAISGPRLSLNQLSPGRP